MENPWYLSMPFGVYAGIVLTFCLILISFGLRHLFAEGFYPSSGSASEVGAEAGLGYTVNVALPEGYTDACLLRACEDVLVPAAQRFHPDLLLVSAGFDAVSEDPLGDAECTPDGFARVTRLLCGLAHKLCGGRLLFALEGGYNHSALASCMAAVAQNLLHGVDSIDIDTEEKFLRFVATCSGKLEKFEPLKASLGAIWDTRWAHQCGPLRLLDGCTWSNSLVPSSRFRRKRKCSHWRHPRDFSDSDTEKQERKYVCLRRSKSCSNRNLREFVISLRSLRFVFGIFETLMSEYLLLSLEK